MFGQKDEKKQLSKEYLGQCKFQVQLKTSRLTGEKRRDDYETKKCQDIFMEECEKARAAEVAKAEMRRRVAEENMMLASNKKRASVQVGVLDNMKQDKDTYAS